MYPIEEQNNSFSKDSLNQALKMRSIFSDSLKLENRRINEILEDAFLPYLEMIKTFICDEEYELECFIKIQDRSKFIPLHRIGMDRTTEPYVYLDFRWLPLAETDEIYDMEVVDFGEDETKVKKILKKFSSEIGLPVYVHAD